MEVAYVIPSLSPSSGWRSLSLGAIGALQRNFGIRPLLIVSAHDEAAARQLLPDCRYVALPHTQHLVPGRLRGLPALLSARARTRGITTEALLVHSLEAYPTGLVGHWLANRLDRPHVITAVGTYSVRWVQSRSDRPSFERVLAGAGAICAISHGTADLMRQHIETIEESRLRVVWLGTDYHRTVPRESACAHVAPSPPVVLSVGAIKPRKGYEASLRAFARLKARFPDARYRIIGRVDQPGYFATLKCVIADEDIRDVEFMTELSDAELDEAYRHASVFLLTPERHGLEFEGFGLVYLEAGAYGLPVVATASGGVSDAVRHQETGLVAQPGNVEEIARHLTAILENSELAQRLGRANRRWAEQLTWERFAKQQYAVYDELLHREPAT